MSPTSQTVIESTGTFEGSLASTANAASFETAFDFDARVTVDVGFNLPISIDGEGIEAQTNSQLTFSSAAGERLSFQIGQIGQIGLTVIVPYEIIVEPSEIELTIGDNIVTGSLNSDRFRGLGGNDTIIGNDGDDLIRGNRGNDVLEGNSGDDLLRGNSGNDTLDGGAGSDRINGGNGNDILVGGESEDTFVGTLKQLDGDRIIDLTDRDEVIFKNASFTRDDVSIALPGLTIGATPFTLWSIDAGEAGSANLTIEGFDAIDFTVTQRGNDTVIKV